MTADLLGYQFTDSDGRTLTVVDPPTPAAIPPGYVYLTDGTGFRTLREAQGLRRYRDLSRQEGGST